MKVASINICILLVYCIVYATAQIDHCWLVQSWPYGYCLSYPCKYKPGVFVLHGLWPVTFRGRTLENSTARADDIIDKINNDSSLVADMNRYWKSLLRRNTELFWVHEWKKHGSAFPHEPLDYFRRTVKLMKRMNLLSTLKAGGVEPRTTSYPKSKYKDAIKAVTSSDNVILKCAYNETGYLLQEVMLCTDYEAETFIECNSYEMFEENCGPDIIFPPRW
uniref:S13-ribonuclease n=1 Tax=Citrus cavaleriei TaxID=2709 RepID=A0A6B9KRS9_9ROSI|nr:S13-ribonuclease [Citrus cavaleriei]